MSEVKIFRLVLVLGDVVAINQCLPECQTCDQPDIDPKLIASAEDMGASSV